MILDEQARLLESWRERTRQLPIAAALDEAALSSALPALLAELAALPPPPQVPGPTPAVEAHARLRAQQGFAPQDLAIEYAALRSCLLPRLLSPDAQRLHETLDQALARALAAHAAEAVIQERDRRLRYFGFVSHKLRTPLNALSLATSLLELSARPEPATTPTRTVPQTLRRNVQYLDQLIEALLNDDRGMDAALGGPLQRHEQPLWPLVEALMPGLRSEAQAQGKQLLNAVPDGLQVHADAKLLTGALHQLATHALAHHPQQALRIEASFSAEDQAIACVIAGSDETLAEGAAMDPMDPEAGSRLTLVKLLVEAHGGRLSGGGRPYGFLLPLEGAAPR